MNRLALLLSTAVLWLSRRLFALGIAIRQRSGPDAPKVFWTSFPDGKARAWEEGELPIVVKPGAWPDPTMPILTGLGCLPSHSRKDTGG